MTGMQGARLYRDAWSTKHKINPNFITAFKYIATAG
jgi:hypothetical protein